MRLARLRWHLLRSAVALPAALLLLAGTATAQAPQTGTRLKPPVAAAKPGDNKPAAGAAEEKPAEPTKPSESAMKPGDVLNSPANPVVAIVEGHMIYLSDVGHAVPQLPENLRGLPFSTLFPVLLDRLIDHQALVALALRKHMDDQPDVRREIDAATDRILEGALLGRATAAAATEEKIQALYNKTYAGRPASEETHARHILVSTEAEAKKLIAELNKGADFPTLARDHSKDPDGKNGGDLGFFRRDQVWPEFADVAFSLQPGQISQTPIQNEFGWHIVKVEERRILAPPAYSDVHDALRKDLLQQAVQQTVKEARSQLAIHKYNIDGSPLGAVPDISPAQPLLKPQDDKEKPSQ